MKTKAFDCVRMKREGAERLRRLLETLTPEERRAFWEEAYRQLLERKQSSTRNPVQEERR